MLRVNKNLNQQQKLRIVTKVQKKIIDAGKMSTTDWSNLATEYRKSDKQIKRVWK